ncbi:MAG: prepilin-type N-terminal cleavage/methylation domain-containing protein [Sedimentisphaerales bacterium]
MKYSEFIRDYGKGETKMKPNTSLTNAASINGTSDGPLAGRGRRALTLIELLVVMAIISLLMGLFVHYILPPKKHVNQIKCDSNLKNLFLALQMYADDNDGLCPNPNVTGQIPISLKMKEALQPYVPSEDIFWCPDDPEKEKEAHPGGSYGWRVTRDPKTSLAGVRLALLRHPERVMIAGELSHGCHGSEMINVLYADGHVDLITMGEFIQNIRNPLEL